MATATTSHTRSSVHAGRRVTKAAILVEQRAPLVVTEVELPSLEVGQVLIKVAASGICGKQLDEIAGRQGQDPFLPHLLGHEGAGTVVEVGPGVRRVKPGDHVVLHWMKGPGIDAIPPSFRWNGTTLNAGCVTTFSEYTVASENRLTPIPADVSLELAALFGCAILTGLGIVFNNAELKPGQSLAVFGIGGVGMNVLQGARLVNAHPIVAVDLHDDKLERARLFGATHTINAARDDVARCVQELSAGRGMDAAVDTTGVSHVRELAYNATSATGRTIFAGVPLHTERITIDSFPIHFGRRLIGVHGGDSKPEADIPRYLQLYRLGKLKLAEQITHRFRLDDINAAVAQVQQGRAVRCLIVL